MKKLFLFIGLCLGCCCAMAQSVEATIDSIEILQNVKVMVVLTIVSRGATVFTVSSSPVEQFTKIGSIKATARAIIDFFIAFCF